MCIPEQSGHDHPIDIWHNTTTATQEDIDVTPKIDLRSLNYLASTKSLEYISCPICKLPFIEPWSTVCGHTFCKECIFESFKSGVLGERCPLDRVHLHISVKIRHQLGLNNDYVEEIGDDDDNDESDVYPAPIIVSNMTDDLEVLCLNSDRGCKWSGERWSIKKHIRDDCEYTRIKCVCGELCQRKVLIDNGMLKRLPSGSFSIASRRCLIDQQINKVILHDDSDAYGGTFSDDPDEQVADDDDTIVCPHTLIECVECESEIRILDIADHLEHECLKNMVVCNGCHLSFPLMHLESHQKHCQEIYIDCPGLKYGCTWKGQRAILDEIHEHDCVFIKMGGYLDKMENGMKSLNKENEGLRLQMSSILNSVVNGKVHNLGYPLEIEEVHREVQPVHRRTDIDGEITSDGSSSTQRISMSKVKMLVRELEMNKNVTKTLLEDNVNLHEQLNSQRAMLSSLQQQIQFMMIERRRMFVSKGNTNAKNVATKL